MLFFILFQTLILLLVYATFASSMPQFIDLTRATISNTRQQLGGLSSLTSHAKTVQNAHSRVHKHSTQISNPILRRRIVRRRRPALTVSSPVADTFTVNLPRQTDALYFQQQPVVQRTRPQQQLIQTSDGRYFLVSTGEVQVQPGQFFQTADGRFFTVIVDNENPEEMQMKEIDENEVDDDADVLSLEEEVDAFDVAEAARIREEAREAELEKKKQKRRRQQQQLEADRLKKAREEEARKKAVEDAKRRQRAKEAAEKEAAEKAEQERIDAAIALVQAQREQEEQRQQQIQIQAQQQQQQIILQAQQQQLQQQQQQQQQQLQQQQEIVSTATSQNAVVPLNSIGNPTTSFVLPQQTASLGGGQLFVGPRGQIFRTVSFPQTQNFVPFNNGRIQQQQQPQQQQQFVSIPASTHQQLRVPSTPFSQRFLVYDNAGVAYTF